MIQKYYRQPLSHSGTKKINMHFEKYQDTETKAFLKKLTEENKQFTK